MKIRLYFLLVLIAAKLLSAAEETTANRVIREVYADTESGLVSNVVSIKSGGVPEDERKILELGYIRSTRAVTLLFERLAIPHSAFLNMTNSVPSPYELVDFGGPLVISAGPFSGYRERYPAYKSLLRIGVPLNDCLSSRTHQENGTVTFMLFCLSKLAAGAYFDHFIETNSNAWASVSSFEKTREIVLQSPMAKVFSTYPCPNSPVASRYDAMQDELIARFKSQFASGDAEIADTIYTMGFIRSDRAMPLLIDNLTVCPQVSTNAPSGFVFPAAEALISIWPPLGICFEKLEAAAPMSLDESLWLRITHEIYPEALEYDLMKKAEADDARARRLLQSLPWRRL